LVDSDIQVVNYVILTVKVKLKVLYLSDKFD